MSLNFLFKGSRIFFRELTTSNIDFISTTLVDWLLEPDLVPGDHAEEVMDLLLEYFKGISDVLIACNKTKERRNEPLSEQNRKHLAMYVINEINLFSSKDLENFVGDVNNLLTDIDPKKRRSSANKK